LQEFAYIQFSNDFDKVIYGSEDQVNKLRQIAEDESEDFPKSEEEQKEELERAAKKTE